VSFRGRRRRLGSLAAIIAAWFVVSGVLAMHHEATVAHARDRAGAYVHARSVDGHQVGGDSDVHGEHNPGKDRGDCALLTAFHQAGSASVTTPAVVTTARAVHVRALPVAAPAVVATAIYRPTIHHAAGCDQRGVTWRLGTCIRFPRTDWGVYPGRCVGPRESR
jgi:hypothetical protein